MVTKTRIFFLNGHTQSRKLEGEMAIIGPFIVEDTEFSTTINTMGFYPRVSSRNLHIDSRNLLKLDGQEKSHASFAPIKDYPNITRIRISRQPTPQKP